MARDPKRSDMLKIAELTIAGAERAAAGFEAKTIVLALIIRMLFWCGIYTLNREREAFFEQSCVLIQRHFSLELAVYCSEHYLNDFDAVVLAALYTNSTTFLVRRAALNRLRITDMIALLLHRKLGRRPRKIAIRMTLDRVAQMIRTPISIALRICRRLFTLR